jgi:hypothetical protein
MLSVSLLMLSVSLLMLSVSLLMLSVSLLMLSVSLCTNQISLSSFHCIFAYLFFKTKYKIMLDQVRIGRLRLVEVVKDVLLLD